MIGAMKDDGRLAAPTGKNGDIEMMAALGFALRSACLRMQEGFAGGFTKGRRVRPWI